MKKNITCFEKYTKLKSEGISPVEIFKEAKKDGYKNFECINLLMVLFDMSLNEARQVSHDLFLNNE